jgi:glycolate oxidase FAD binding subunit
MNTWISTELAVSSVAEVGEIVRRARSEDQAVFPLGGRTMLDFGLPAQRPGIGVDLRPLATVVDYPARDMTITVQAGITLARLQTILAAENQRLPIDIPLPEAATLGGVLATNASGPRRLGFGTLRDYVIGISVVNDEGQEVKAGGRVVKNVAGYDLCKLYIGSLGTLGVITQVTLKLKPRPEQSTLIGMDCPRAQLATLLDQLQTSRTRPTSLTVLSPGAAGSLLLSRDDAWTILVAFEDNCEATAWQVEQLRREMREAGIAANLQLTDTGAEPLWQALADFPLTVDCNLTFKANLLPSATAEFCQRASELFPGILLQAQAGNGIVIGHVPGALTREQAHEMLKGLQALAIAAAGNVIVLRCPPEWKAVLPVWGASRGDVELMRAVKEKLDPRRLFNPGRFVAGI